MTQVLSGKKILILVANGVDEAAMSAAQRELLKTGAVIKTVGTEPGLVNSWNNNSWGLFFTVDQPLNMTLGSDFDYLVVPSGSRAVQKLSGTPHAERIISSFIDAGKHVAFMGDAVELLAKTGLAKGWRVAGPERIHQTMVAAGAEWQGNGECVHNIVMSGDYTDVNALIQNMVSYFAATVELKAAA